MSAYDRKMESAGLGWRISGAIRRMMEASIVDEKVFDLCLKEIKLALLQTDVPLSLVRDLQINVKNRVEDNCSAASYDKHIVLQSIFDELCEFLDPGKLPLKRSHSTVIKYGVTRLEIQKNIVMFVGLQGCGKSTACTQFANYYKKQGFRPAIVSVDTFRASTFDQLMQTTMAATIPLYGSFIQSDSVSEIALSGVDWFKKRSKDLIIIDTSERHTEVSSLIEDMSEVYHATRPDVVIFVVDSGIGRAAFQQVQLFKQTVQVGGVIMTNMNYDRKAGETFSAIAATKTPIMFIGRGEGLEEFEVFDIKPFVSRLLGLQEILGFKEDVILDLDVHTNYSLRVYHMFIHMSEKFAGPSVMGLRKLRILNSLGSEELDGRLQNLLSCSFILRIAKTSGFSVAEVLLLMEDHKIMVDVCEKCDRTRFPVCEYFDKIFPGVIVDNPAIRMKIEAGEDINKPTKEELIEISKSYHPKPWDSKRVSRFKREKQKQAYKHCVVEGRVVKKPVDPVDSIAEEKRKKKEMEDEALVLAALYGKGKPLEAKREKRTVGRTTNRRKREIEDVAELPTFAKREEGMVGRTMNLVDSMPKEKKQKREIEDNDAAELGQVKPLEAKKKDGEGSKRKAAVKVEAHNYNNFCQLLSFYRLGNLLSDYN